MASWWVYLFWYGFTIKIGTLTDTHSTELYANSDKFWQSTNLSNWPSAEPWTTQFTFNFDLAIKTHSSFVSTSHLKPKKLNFEIHRLILSGMPKELTLTYGKNIFVCNDWSALNLTKKTLKLTCTAKKTFNSEYTGYILEIDAFHWYNSCSSVTN